MSLKSSTYFGSTEEILQFIFFICDESGFGFKWLIYFPLWSSITFTSISNNWQRTYPHLLWVSKNDFKCVIAKQNSIFQSQKCIFMGCLSAVATLKMWKLWSMAAIRPENQRTHLHRQRINQLVATACPYSLQRSVCVFKEVLITPCSLALLGTDLC